MTRKQKLDRTSIGMRAEGDRPHGGKRKELGIGKENARRRMRRSESAIKIVLEREA